VTSKPGLACVRFNYMYRDGGNYKQHGSVVLANEEALGVAEAAARLHAACVSDDSFNAAQVGLPELFFDDGVVEDDHSWHEFVSFEVTHDEPTDPRSLSELTEVFERARAGGWRIDAGRLTAD